MKCKKCGHKIAWNEQISGFGLGFGEMPPFIYYLGMIAGIVLGIFISVVAIFPNFCS